MSSELHAVWLVTKLAWNVTGPKALLSLEAWQTEQALQSWQAGTEQQTRPHSCSFSWVLAAGVAAAGLGSEAHCESSSYAAEQNASSRWSRLLHRADPRQLFPVQEHNAFLQEMQADPKVSCCFVGTQHQNHTTIRCQTELLTLKLAFTQFLPPLHVPLQVSVVLALALPFLSLSFGYVPAKHELDMAAQLVQANADKLQGWEISSLVWAAARLGYRPADSVMDALLQQVLLTTALAITFCTLPTFTACSPETPSRQCRSTCNGAGMLRAVGMHLLLLWHGTTACAFTLSDSCTMRNSIDNVLQPMMAE